MKRLVCNANVSEFISAMRLLGFKELQTSKYNDSLTYEFQDNSSGLYIRTSYHVDGPTTTYYLDGKRLPKYKTPPDTANLALMINNIESVMNNYNLDIFSNYAIMDISNRSTILAAINTRDLSKDMVRVKSSNVWSYKLNVKDRHDKVGDLLVQFKNDTGGPGDLYMYYDVPLVAYRRWQSAPSKGHYFWVYIRNNYKYSKLTGDKRGKLHNAVN